MSRDIGDRMSKGDWHMPARPRIPDPSAGPLQEYAYDLRQLGHGKASVAWIAGHEQTDVSRAALYAALSGTRLPLWRTTSTLLRWWAGNPTEEGEIRPSGSYVPNAEWAERLPLSHEGRRLVDDWWMRHIELGLVRASEQAEPAPSVTIAVPAEQKVLIGQLRALIRRTGLEDELWLLFGADTARVERYLAGRTIPTKTSCVRLADQVGDFIPNFDFYDASERLLRAAEAARTGRARDRRIARGRRQP
jgi:hypothetical protein